MSAQNDTYKNMTNPEIVAAFGRLSEDEQADALASLPEDRQAALKEVIASQPPADGARAAVLARLGRDKQFRDAQAYTSDGKSPNGPLVTEANPHTEHASPEAAIEQMVAQTAEKQAGDLLALAGQDTSTTLSTDEAAKGKAAVKSFELGGTEDSGDAGKKLRGKLPDDFPHKAFLEAGGVTTYAQVRKQISDGTLTGIANIGAGRAAEIEAAVHE